MVSRVKSDSGDALVLTNIARTDLAAHRPVPADSEHVLSIRVLARAQQDAIWDANRRRTSCAACSTSTPHLPSHRPTPTAAAQKLRRPSSRAALVRAGRRRNIDYQVNRILAGLRGEQFTQLPLVEQRWGARLWPISRR